MNPYGYKEHISSRSMVIANQNNILRVFRSAVTPVLSELNAETAKFQTKAESGDQFARVSVDLQKFSHRELTISLCLVVQSVWERQFRSFLEILAHEIPDQELQKLALGNNWTAAFKAFTSICTSKLGDLPPGVEKLDLLFHLANACRHGAGKSLATVYRMHPDLWPEGVGISSESQPSMFGLCIPESMLEEFIVAIALFWEWLSLHPNLSKATD